MTLPEQGGFNERLDAILDLLGERCIMQEHGLTNGSKQDEIARSSAAIQSIIRTEKLKLLAEVRERAIPNPTTPAGDNEFVPLDELTKLEAEL